MDEDLALVERGQVHRLRIAETNDAEIRVARRIDDGDRVGELLGGVDAVFCAERKIRRIGRERRLPGVGCAAREQERAQEQQMPDVHRDLSSLAGDVVAIERSEPWRVEEAVHIGDLLSLLDDDRLRQAFESLVVSVFQQHQRHVDRSLVMRDHHPHEVAIDVVAGQDRHAVMHARIYISHLGIKGRRVAVWRSLAQRKRAVMLMRGFELVAGAIRKAERQNKRGNSSAGEGSDC